MKMNIKITWPLGGAIYINNKIHLSICQSAANQLSAAINKVSTGQLPQNLLNPI